MEIETIRKSQMEATLEMENKGKRSGAAHASFPSRIPETEEKISGIEYTLEEIHTTVKESAKRKKILT